MLLWCYNWIHCELSWKCFLLPVCICINSPSTRCIQAYAICQDEGCLVWKGFSRGREGGEGRGGGGGAERAVSQCCLCLVWSVMSWRDRGLQSRPLFRFSFLSFKVPHRKASLANVREGKHSTSSLALNLMLLGGTKQNAYIFAVATMPLLFQQVYYMNVC